MLVGLYIYSSNDSIQIKKPTPPNTTEQIAVVNESEEETPKPKTNKGWVKYTNQRNNYKVEYPNTWEYENVNTSTIKVTSPDFKMSQEYPVLLEGVQVYIFAKETTETSGKSSFDNDPLASDIATNVTETTLDGVDAIEYDISFEGTVATVTKAVKNGMLYTVQFRYPSKEDKASYDSVRQKILDSFLIE